MIGPKGSFRNYMAEEKSDVSGSISFPKPPTFAGDIKIRQGAGLAGSRQTTGGKFLINQVDYDDLHGATVKLDVDAETLTLDPMKRMHPVAHHVLSESEPAMEDFKRFLADQRRLHEGARKFIETELETARQNRQRERGESEAYKERAKALSDKFEKVLVPQQLFLARIGKLIEGQVDLLPMDLEDNDKPLGPPTTFGLCAAEVRAVLNAYWDLVADQMEQKIGKHTFEMENSDFELLEKAAQPDVKPFTKSMVNEAFQMIDAQQRSSAVSAMKAEARKAAERRRMARMIQS